MAQTCKIVNMRMKTLEEIGFIVYACVYAICYHNHAHIFLRYFTTITTIMTF